MKKVLFLILLCVHNVQSGILGTLQQKWTNFKVRVSTAFNRKKSADQQPAQMQNQELGGRSFVDNSAAQQQPKKSIIKRIGDELSSAGKRIVRYFKPIKSNRWEHLPNTDEPITVHPLRNEQNNFDMSQAERATYSRNNLLSRSRSSVVAHLPENNAPEEIAGLKTLNDDVEPHTPYSPQRRQLQSTIQVMPPKAEISKAPSFITPQSNGNRASVQDIKPEIQEQLSESMPMLRTNESAVPRSSVVRSVIPPKSDKVTAKTREIVEAVYPKENHPLVQKAFHDVRQGLQVRPADYRDLEKQSLKNKVEKILDDKNLPRNTAEAAPATRQRPNSTSQIDSNAGVQTLRVSKPETTEPSLD